MTKDDAIDMIKMLAEIQGEKGLNINDVIRIVERIDEKVISHVPNVVTLPYTGNTTNVATLPYIPNDKICYDASDKN